MNIGDLVIHHSEPVAVGMVIRYYPEYNLVDVLFGNVVHQVDEMDCEVIDEAR